MANVLILADDVIQKNSSEETLKMFSKFIDQSKSGIVVVDVTYLLTIDWIDTTSLLVIPNVSIQKNESTVKLPTELGKIIGKYIELGGQVFNFNSEHFLISDTIDLSELNTYLKQAEYHKNQTETTLIQSNLTGDKKVHLTYGKNIFGFNRLNKPKTISSLAIHHECLTDRAAIVECKVGKKGGKIILFGVPIIFESCANDIQNKTRRKLEETQLNRTMLVRAILSRFNLPINTSNENKPQYGLKIHTPRKYIMIYQHPTIKFAYEETVKTFMPHINFNKIGVRIVDCTFINKYQNWEKEAVAVVLPGGIGSTHYYDTLGKESGNNGNVRIRQFVRNGGAYIGFGSGGYYGATHTEFAKGKPYEKIRAGELGFFEGVARGPIGDFPTKKIMTVTFRNAKLSFYYFGGCCFEENSNKKPIKTVASARYTNNSLALLILNVGKGKALLCGPYAQYNSTATFLLTDTDKNTESLRNELDKTHEARKVFFADTFKKLGIQQESRKDKKFEQNFITEPQRQLS